MIHLSLKTDFTRAERALQLLAAKQIPFAAAQALNDCARAASIVVNKAMPAIFDRPTPFTQRAVVAPRELAAQKDRLAAVLTVRPIQAKYLLRQEVGGTRVPSENTRAAASALVLPGRGLLLDGFGNIPAGTLRKLKAAARPKTRRRKAAKGQAKIQDDTVVFLPRDAPANKAGIGGYFRRLAGGKLTRLTVFEATTHYRPRLGFEDRVGQAARTTWPSAFRRRLVEAIATAR